VSEIRRRRYSYRTEQTYLQWIRRFIASNGGRNPRALGAADVRSFLEDLAVRSKVAASTQNQALSALLFLYRHVLEQPLQLGEFKRAKRLHALDPRPPTIRLFHHGTVPEHAYIKELAERGRTRRRLDSG